MQFPTHRFYEDIMALFCAGVMVSLGVTLYNSNQLITGGTAGIAIIGMHLSSLSFGVLFFLVNVPFYYIAWTKLSKRFTINTFISVSIISVMTDYMPMLIHIDNVHPVFAASVGGMLIGVGMLIMFRHKSSLGGLGILALYLQNKYSIRAGNFGLLIDTIILSSSLLMFPVEVVFLSVMGAAMLNVLIAINHKPGRYQAYVETKVKKSASAFKPEKI
ncbi:YitT family protein [Shewanella ulleungensis]|uniref:Membrane protein n=1 Tax=Shewanella ulleungensis TaxID=2282699 RepID=A0ABQ2QL08_9GAMM|nr:YitT family protein [Shewanella ulleungensis]MCL1150074.1 YitT family protein [Shewanella ulleungensis]GGP86521.1 membrane protein [Shewanella ulleungensis]